MNYKNRQQRLEDYYKDQNLDGFLVLDTETVFWLTGFKGSFGMYFQQGKTKVLVSDSRYKLKAAEICKTSGVNFLLYDTDFSERFGKKQRGIFGVDTSLKISELRFLEKIFSNIEIKPQKQCLQQLRRVKDANEIGCIKKAQTHVDRVLFSFLKEQAVVGITEKALTYKLRLILEEEGMYGLSFDPIIAFGENSAMAHHEPGEKRLDVNMNILVDCGVTYKGYCSDMTRNAFFGKVSSKYKEMYDLLLKAQEISISLAISGQNIADIDTAVRKELGEYEKYFTHSLGHGVGLEIHELPTISAKAEGNLEVGDIITLEPGVYFDGEFGIRIEDLLVITENGADVLSTSSKELLVL